MFSNLTISWVNPFIFTLLFFITTIVVKVPNILSEIDDSKSTSSIAIKLTGFSILVIIAYLILSRLLL